MRKLATDQAGLEILHLGDMFRLLTTAAQERLWMRIRPTTITGRRMASPDAH